MLKIQLVEQKNQAPNKARKASMNNADKPSYSQPVKQQARSKALTHAVELLTKYRQNTAIAPPDYVRTLRDHCATLDYFREYPEAAQNCQEEDVVSWEKFRNSVVGKLNPEDLTIAYLAGPEPTNDINTLIELGVRAENIWAFEINTQNFESAIADVKNKEIRGIKLIKMKMEEYFTSTPRRFDIIYFDACATFPSHEQKTLKIVSSIFKSSSLSSLGVLITNFSSPDTSNSKDLENYSHLITANLYSKSTLDRKEGGNFFAGESAEAYGFDFSKGLIPEEEEYTDKYFLDEVKGNFDFYYGSFITRHIMDIASITAPTDRLARGQLWKSLFKDQAEVVNGCKKWLSPIAPETYEFDHDYIYEGGNFSLIKALSYLGVDNPDIKYPDGVSDFIIRWLKQLDDNGDNKRSVDTILSFYGCKENTEYWAESIPDLKNFNYKTKMPQLCDVPTTELAFYSLFAQYAYPAHCNVNEVRRYSYIAEGKKNRMFLDVLPFDECRYVYDWLSSAHLVAGDWEKMSTQITFRFALDSIVKNIHNYQDDFLFGAHAVGIGEKFQCGELKERINLTDK